MKRHDYCEDCLREKYLTINTNEMFTDRNRGYKVYKVKDSDSESHTQMKINQYFAKENEELKETVASLQKSKKAQAEEFNQKLDSLKEYFEQALQEQRESLMSEIYAPPEENKSETGGAGYRKAQTHFETSTKK